MKDLYMLAGFGLGLITGAMLYKYSKETKKMVDNGEKNLMKEAEKLGNKAEKATEKLGDKAEKGIQKVEQAVKKGNKALKKQMSK